MSTAVARRKPAQKAKTVFKKLTEEQVLASEEIWIPLEAVQITHNDRTEFDQQAIDTLAVSIAERGLDNAITIRKMPGTPGVYELIAGERRLRACRQLKLANIRAKVIAADDRHADLLRLEENMLREDLNQIERAAGLKRYMELHGESQTEVGKRFGMTQAQVSNLLRLLQLPAYWQNQVASGTIGHTIVRDVLLPWAHRPQVLEMVIESFDGSVACGETLDRFELQHEISKAVHKCSRSVRKEHVHQWTKIDGQTCCFKYDAAKHEKLLDVEDNRAWNLEEWEKLNEPARKKAVEKQKAEKAKSASETSVMRSQSKVAKAKESKDVDEFKLKAALKTQLLLTLAEVISPRKHKNALPLLVLYIATEDCPTQFMTEDGKFCRDEDLLKILQNNAADPFGMFQQIVARWAKSEPYSPDEPSILVGLADLLPYDLLHEWKPTAEVLECFSNDQLQAFAHDHEIEHDQPRAKLIENLIAAWPEGYCPAEVLKACGRAKQ